MATTSATSSINASGISVGSDGKVKVSGLTSNIDSQAIINATITAKRLPAVRLETNIKNNTTLISAYGDLKTKATALTSSLDSLRGNPGYGAASVFKQKTTTGTTEAAAGAPSGYTPSSVSDLVVASISTSAVNGTYKINVQQTAKAQQIRSDVQTSKTDPLGLPNGTFTLNGKTIQTKSTDSLLDIRAAINAAGAGVTATIVSSASNANYLVLTSSKTGTDSAAAFGGDTTITDALGLTTTTDSGGNTVAAGTVKTELQAAQNAKLSVNGVTGIERQTNSIDDVIEGVTLSLQKAEPNTNINLDIGPDLSAIKTAVAALVDAYNGMRDFVTDQRTAKDRNGDGTIGDNEVGPLAYDTTTRQIIDRLSTLTGTTVAGNPDGFKSLSQLGITMGSDFKLSINETTLDNRLLTDEDSVRKLFALDVSSSDARVNLVGRGSETLSGTYYLNVQGTNAAGSVFGANIQTAAGNGNGGAANGSVSPTGGLLTATSATSANGLKLLFSGGNNSGPVTDVAVTVSRGVADLSYDFFKNLTDPTVGTLDTKVTELNTQNKDYSDRVTVIDSRLDVTKAFLVNKYTAMETALANLDNLKKTIQGYSDSLNAKS